MSDADVIIAGAGMAGTTLALALASGGLSSILIDPAAFESQLAESFDGRASAISFSAFRQWRAVGAARFLEDGAQRIEQILVTDGRAAGASAPGAHSAFIRFDSAEIAGRTDGEPLGYMLENRRIRAGLAQAVGETAAITVMAPARVARVEVTPSAAKVILEDGQTLAAPLVVGAEGRGSVVRREAGIGTLGWGYGQTGVVATVALETDHQGVAYEYFLPAGPFAILPLIGKRASLVWTESDRHGAALKAVRPEAFDAFLKRRFGDFLGKLTVVGPRFTYPLALQLADRLTAPRVALLGDAAHGVHPIAGQGLNLGLKDAAALAEVLVEAIRLGEDPGAPTVLERYARWRSLDNIGLALATDVFTRLFSTDNTLVRAARDAGMAVVNRIGPARRFFMQEAGGATGDLPRLLKGQAL
ncbi:MAG TPA: UbiH/UbiF/VisC/COQ6 family ubiquinone biosynthesis hydroxylase [Caulobacteraceae bacterium]|nr:UbiH/UbiF/VisC/COQ6 family ubiquinone biosynthesis hydroxylase [Caulobacteraceae bacterium]